MFTTTNTPANSRMIHRRSFSFSERTILESAALRITVSHAATTPLQYPVRYSTPTIVIDHHLDLPVRVVQFTNWTPIENKIETAVKTMKQCDNTDTCAICLEDAQEIQLNCGHIFHEECITQVIKNSCPMCRAPIF